MKAEEYLISRDIMPQRPNKWKWIDSPSVNMADALKSVEMARKEERSKLTLSNQWHETNYVTNDVPKDKTWNVVRIEIVDEDGEKRVDYQTAFWDDGEWCEDNLGYLGNYDEYKITHWMSLPKLNNIK